jgi:hypothetical protein
MLGTYMGRCSPTDENEPRAQEPDATRRTGKLYPGRPSGYELALLAATVSVVTFAFAAEYRTLATVPLVVSVTSLLTAVWVSLQEVVR